MRQGRLLELINEAWDDKAYKVIQVSMDIKMPANEDTAYRFDEIMSNVEHLYAYKKDIEVLAGDYENLTDVYEKQGYFEESYKLNEKRNPENDEVNAIIRKRMRPSAKITKKEQEVLDRYGIRKNEDGIFVGPNGKVLRTEYGKVSPTSGPKRPEWHFGKNRGAMEPPYSHRHHSYIDMNDENVDFANYLTSEKDSDANYENEIRAKSKGYRPKSIYTKSEYDSLHPYSDDYKRAKSESDWAKSELDWRNKVYGDDIKSDDEIEAEVERFKQDLINRNKANKSYIQQSQDEYDEREKARQDILDKARAKHQK